MSAVNRPEHYQGKRFDVIDIIEEFNLGFNLGNTAKYVLRAGKKDDIVQDLEKAKWYIEREIKRLKGVKGLTEIKVNEHLEAQQNG